MPLNKQHGNMYPWITHTWNPIRGRCPHDCIYCYMKSMRWDIGEMRLAEKELHTNLGKGNTIFVGSSTDMWAEDVPKEWILKVLEHCRGYPDNVYLFQSKNPKRFLEIFSFYDDLLPQNTIIGTTIETNRDTSHISKAPSPYTRFVMMVGAPFTKMISIEPIMDFDLEEFVQWLKIINPKFVSIGADSKNHNLPEPPAWKVKKLISELEKFTEVKVKDNLNRIVEVVLC